MDIHAKQHSNDERKDHPTDLKQRNARDAASNIEPIKMTLDVRKKLSISNGDISECDVDAIVNCAHGGLTGGGGLDGLLHSKAGDELRSECLLFPEIVRGSGVRCNEGDCVVTKGHRLKARHVIHAVGPIGEDAALLKQTYLSVLKKAQSMNLRTLAIPCISTGFFGFPQLPAARIALQTTVEFIESNENWSNLERIQFVVYNDNEYLIYQKLFREESV